MSIPTQELSAGSQAEGTPIHEFGPFRLDPRERLLTRDGQPVALTPKALDLLVYLVERPGRLVEKQALMAALWPDAVVEEANLAYTVSALRKALGDGHDGEQIIQTVPTRGYRFVAPVRVVLPEPSSTSASGRSGRRFLIPVIFVIGVLAGGVGGMAVAAAGLDPSPGRALRATRRRCPGHRGSGGVSRWPAHRLFGPGRNQRATTLHALPR